MMQPKQEKQLEQPKYKKQWNCHPMKNHYNKSNNKIKVSSNKPEIGGE
jgi:hypothetical protein